MQFFVDSDMQPDHKRIYRSERKRLAMLMKKPEPSTPESKQNSPAVNPPVTPPLPISSAERRKGPKTRITIRYDVGFGNLIYLRGKGANLSWERGVQLRNVKSDEWVWETETAFTSCEFKVLINDKIYELGDNHTLNCGTSIHYSPKFN